jgi:hypothetical protein
MGLKSPLLHKESPVIKDSSPEGQLQELLATTMYSQLPRLQYEFDGDTVVIQGTVPSFYFKQLAQEACKQVGLQATNKLVVKAQAGRRC